MINILTSKGQSKMIQIIQVIFKTLPNQEEHNQGRIILYKMNIKRPILNRKVLMMNLNQLY